MFREHFENALVHIIRLWLRDSDTTPVVGFAFIPYWHLVIDIPLSPGEAATILSDNLVRHVLHAYGIDFPRPYEGNSFVGKVSPDGFKIRRRVSYYNSFIPTLHGKFYPMAEGTRIDVICRMYPYTEGFLLLWCFPFLVFTIYAIVSLQFVGVFCLSLPMLAYMGTLAGFNFELNKSIALLHHVLLTHEIRTNQIASSKLSDT